jgi:hypothetical protein
VILLLAFEKTIVDLEKLGMVQKLDLFVLVKSLEGDQNFELVDLKSFFSNISCLKLSGVNRKEFLAKMSRENGGLVQVLTSALSQELKKE